MLPRCWCITNALLVHCWCIVGALSVRRRCVAVWCMARYILRGVPLLMWIAMTMHIIACSEFVRITPGNGFYVVCVFNKFYAYVWVRWDETGFFIPFSFSRFTLRISSAFIYILSEPTTCQYSWWGELLTTIKVLYKIFPESRATDKVGEIVSWAGETETATAIEVYVYMQAL